MLMALGTLLPVGAIQAWTSFTDGLWKARDYTFLQRGAVEVLGTLRIIPDLIIIVLGVVPLAIFLLRTYPRIKPALIKDGESVWERIGVEL